MQEVLAHCLLFGAFALHDFGSRGSLVIRWNDNQGDYTVEKLAVAGRDDVRRLSSDIFIRQTSH